MENEILQFDDSLTTQDYTPEVRAIQIETFLLINQPALTQLEAYRRQLSTERWGNPPLSPPPVPAEATPAEKSKLLRHREILSQAEKLSPEQRAIFIEDNSQTLRQTTSLLTPKELLLETQNPINPTPQPKPTSPRPQKH